MIGPTATRLKALYVFAVVLPFAARAAPVRLDPMLESIEEYTITPIITITAKTIRLITPICCLFTLFTLSMFVSPPCELDPLLCG